MIILFIYHFTVSLKTLSVVHPTSSCFFRCNIECIYCKFGQKHLQNKSNVMIKFTVVNTPQLWASGRDSGLRRRRWTACRCPQRRQEGRRRRSSAQNNAAFSTFHQTLHTWKLCIIILQQWYLISSIDKIFITQQIIYRDHKYFHFLIA